MDTQHAAYRVSVSRTVRGDRWVYFATLEAARRFCNDVFEQCGIVLAIVANGTEVRS